MSVAVAMGLAATVLGCVAGKKSKGFVLFEDLDGQQHCVYPRNPALRCGVAAALLALTGVTLATATVATTERHAPTGTVAVRRNDAVIRKRLFLGSTWVTMVIATVMFLCGAAMKRGLSERPYWCHGRYYDHGCTGLRSGLFFKASFVSALATLFIAAYVPTDEDEPAPGVEMGQPQWAQPYPPPPPVANPASPQYGHAGYGPSQPAAGTVEIDESSIHNSVELCGL